MSKDKNTKKELEKNLIKFKTKKLSKKEFVSLARKVAKILKEEEKHYEEYENPPSCRIFIQG